MKLCLSDSQTKDEEKFKGATIIYGFSAENSREDGNDIIRVHKEVKLTAESLSWA